MQLSKIKILFMNFFLYVSTILLELIIAVNISLAATQAHSRVFLKINTTIDPKLIHMLKRK